MRESTIASMWCSIPNLHKPFVVKSTSSLLRYGSICRSVRTQFKQCPSLMLELGSSKKLPRRERFMRTLLFSSEATQEYKVRTLIHSATCSRGIHDLTASQQAN
mmetsp:Transcript_34088/g.84976  ORF Transcript_34088/g.84976 Transcript_34088/m.84976 type:complete len:104 (+) Transcript_34088:1208-1519(+)